MGMGNNTSILRITLLSVILLSGIGFAFEDAYAATMTFSVNSTISANDVIASGETWTVNPGVILTIDPGVTLTVDNGGLLFNFVGLPMWWR